MAVAREREHARARPKIRFARDAVDRAPRAQLWEASLESDVLGVRSRRSIIACGPDFVIRAGPRGYLLRVVSAPAPGPVRNSGGLYLRFSTQERHRGLLPRRGHESGLPLARGLERLVAGGLAARRVLFSASAFCLLDLSMRSVIKSGTAPRYWVGAVPFSASFVGSDRPSFRIRRVRPRRCVPVQFT